MPDEVGLNHFRLLLNASMRARGKRCRRGGWVKLLDGLNETYNNEDLHDQLLGLQTYYEDFEMNVSIPAGIDSIGYQFQWPYSVTGAYSTSTQLGIRFGDPDENIAAYGYAYPAGCGETGIVSNSTYIHPEHTYLSYFMLESVACFPMVVTNAYGYGSLVYTYTDPNTYLYQYCGTYPYVRDGCEEHITLLASVGNSEGTRTLIAGTRSRLYALNSATGNWKILADGLGSVPHREEEDCDSCPPDRWLWSTVQNEIAFTNGINPPLLFNPLSQPTGCALWRAEEITELEELNIQTAGCVGAWKGFLFFADVFQDGARRGNRIIWSDYNEPRTFIPDDDNLAGFQDLGADEIILRLEQLNDYFFVFTTAAIYRVALVQTDDLTQATFLFEEIYRGEDSLHYKYSLVNTGDAAYYWTTDRLLKITSFDKRPSEVAWMRQASNAVFEGVSEDDLSFTEINREACEHFIGGWNPQYKELWWSWPTGSNRCPTQSMVFNVTAAEEGADFVDHGFTAFHWWSGQVTSTVADFLEDLQVCARSETITGLVKEGDPPASSDATFDNPVLYIWNETEDIDLPAHANSLCRAVANLWLRDICDECDSINKFVMASVTDKCLKEYADRSYYRERLDGAVYVLDGYDTVLQSGVDDVGSFEEKTIHSMSVSVTAEAQSTPSTLYGYLGYGPAPDCIRWDLQQFYDDCSELVDGHPLECMADYTAAEDDVEWTRPDGNAVWPSSVRGKNLGYRLKIEGTGGGCCFSNVEFKLAKV